MAPDRPKVVVLGAGPAGLGAAWRLQELGYDDWELFEAEPRPGGLSASITDPSGFLWDLGVHVLHSHYPYVDQVLDAVLPGELLEHVRDASIWLRERFVPYPLQSHIGQLADEDRLVCLAGLREACGDSVGNTPEDFAHWILQQFGRGVAELFMFPYNRKVWACEPEEMSVEWIGERVASVDPAEILRNAQNSDNRSWGPNAVFLYPRQGGIGAIWDAVFERLPKEKTHLGKQAIRIDTRERVVQFADGAAVAYDRLISTIPLDRLIGMLTQGCELEAAAKRLRHSSLHAIGIGIAGEAPENWKARSWVYFPQEDLVFHRASVLSSFAPRNAPEPDGQWSILAEVTEARDKTVVARQVAEKTLDGLRKVGAIGPGAEVLSVFHRRLEYAYPTPLKGLTDVLRDILPFLANVGIYSRGRFGAWRYEIGNMDHSFMQGVEAVDRVLRGTPERTLRS